MPGWSNYNLIAAFYQSRYVDDQGRVFFNSVEALVPQDTNGKADVYEWEPNGVGGCTPAAETYTEAFSEGAGGCISLISSGKSDHPSVFIDASADGNDVFFLTSGQLVKQDEDSSFDVYDASVCGREGTRACLPEPEATKAPCTELKTCRPLKAKYRPRRPSPRRPAARRAVPATRANPKCCRAKKKNRKPPPRRKRNR